MIELLDSDLEIFERGTIAFPKRHQEKAIRAFGIQTTASSELTEDEAKLMRIKILHALQVIDRLEERIKKCKLDFSRLRPIDIRDGTGDMIRQLDKELVSIYTGEKE